MSCLLPGARWWQFGHVVLFAAVFPLGAIFAIVNNLVEQRSDSFKILFECFFISCILCQQKVRVRNYC